MSTRKRPTTKVYAHLAKAQKMKDFNEGNVCWLCGGDFLWSYEFPDLPGGVRTNNWQYNNLSWSADHVIPYAKAPHLYNVASNIRGAHRG